MLQFMGLQRIRHDLAINKTVNSASFVERINDNSVYFL